jgi:hypothetical protein
MWIYSNKTRILCYGFFDIERHFAWLKYYLGLKYFQYSTLMRVMQFVQLTYIAAFRCFVK